MIDILQKIVRQLQKRANFLRVLTGDAKNRMLGPSGSGPPYTIIGVNFPQVTSTFIHEYTHTLYII